MRRLLQVLFWSIVPAAFIGPGTVTTAPVGAALRAPVLTGVRRRRRGDAAERGAAPAGVRP